MDQQVLSPERFEQYRPRLKAVAYRMLGSLSEADDAVQESWLRASRADSGEVVNLGGWLTTVVARVSLNMLRSRERRREQPLDVRMPDPVVGPADGSDPEQEALLADSVGLAMMVVLDSLTPPERLAFVLHDMFAVPFDVIAPLIERTPAATRQLASRARRRVRDKAPPPDPDLVRQRKVVDAYLSAARHGDFEALVSVLHPDIVLRADGGRARAHLTAVLTGAQEVAGQAVKAAKRLAQFARPVLVNGAAGVVTVVNGRIISVMGFTVTDGKVVAIDVLMDPERLAELKPFLDHDPRTINPD